jgi:hypothetical protein
MRTSKGRALFAAAVLVLALPVVIGVQFVQTLEATIGLQLEHANAQERAALELRGRIFGLEASLARSDGLVNDLGGALTECRSRLAVAENWFNE